jgi:toxin ParE1/3/4
MAPAAKPAVLRALAERDVADAVEYYLAEQAFTAANGLVGELQRALRQIGRQPAIGSTRFAHELGLPGLRSWRLRRFPYTVFYLERADHIDVWRVLHERRDLPAWLAEV